MSISSINDPARLTDIITVHLSMKLKRSKKFHLVNVAERLTLSQKMQGELRSSMLEKN